MKTLILLTLVGLCACQSPQPKFQLGYAGNEEICINDQDVVREFRKAYDPFIMHIFRKGSPKGAYYFTISPISIWTTLAAIGEGADLNAQKEIFRLLNLPNSACSRRKLYKLATTRISPNEHVNIVNTNALVIDEAAQINPQWNNLIKEQSLLQVIPAPLKKDPVAATNIIQKLISANSHELDLSGNSVLVNSLDFSGLWTTAFADAVVERAPFYDLHDKQIGYVDLMKLRHKARIGYSAGLNAKVIELHAGKNKEYSILVAVVVNNDKDIVGAISGLHGDSLNEALRALRDVEEPIDISIPRFIFNSETNVKDILIDMGLRSIWNDSAATRYISTPSALPSSYIQRSSITFSNEGIAPSSHAPSVENLSQSQDKFWTELVANKPFLIGIYDSETYTCLSGTLYTRPTYPL